MISPQVFSMFSQRPPLLRKLSKGPLYFLIRGAKRLLRALGGALTAFFSPQIYPHFETGPSPHILFQAIS